MGEVMKQWKLRAENGRKLSRLKTEDASLSFFLSFFIVNDMKRDTKETTKGKMTKRLEQERGGYPFFWEVGERVFF